MLTFVPYHVDIISLFATFRIQRPPTPGVIYGHFRRLYFAGSQRPSPSVIVATKPGISGQTIILF